MAKTKAKFSVHLDAMRALAAMMVFIMHGKGQFIGPILKERLAHVSARVADPNLADFTNPAHEAVIVFFVLSGFFVGGGVLRAWTVGIWNWKTYAIQRLTRLWIVLIPALLMTLLLDTIGLHLFGLESPYGRLPGATSISTQILSTLNAHTFFGCLFFLQKILVEPLGSNGALWTLAYEFWFYLAFPLLLGALTRRFSWPVRIGNAALLVGAGFFVGPKISAYFLLWLIGAVLQLVPRKLPATVVRRLLPLGVLFLVLVSLAVIRLTLNLFVSDLIEACACAVLCYVILHETEDANQGSLYVRLSRRLSDMSYTLYLTHLPILVFLCALVSSRGYTRGFDPAHVTIYLGASLVAFSVSYLSYLCFERHSDTVRRVLMETFSSSRKVQAVETGV